MKKTQFIELFQNIRNTLVSFISIGIFVALGVAIYVGVSWTSNATVNSLSANLDETKFHDIQILFPYGMDDTDIKELKKIDGVDEVEGSYSAYTYFEMNDDSYQVKLIQLHDDLDLPFEIEGELPHKYNEIVLDKAFAKDNGINIGDTLCFVADNDGSARSIVSIVNFDETSDDLDDLSFSDENKMAYLKTDRFKVTALAKNSEFLNVNKNNYGISPVNKMAIDCFAYLPKSAFDESSFAGYTEVLIRSDSLREYKIADRMYATKVNELKDRINEQLLDHLLEDKNTAMHEAIADLGFLSESKLNEAKEQIEYSEKLIANGKIEIANGRKYLENSLIEIHNGEQDLVNAKAEYDSKASEVAQVDELVNKLKSIRNITDEEIQNAKGSYIERINNVANAAKDRGYDRVYELLSQVVVYIETDHFTEARALIEEAFAYIDGVVSDYHNQLAAGAAKINEGQAKIDEGYQAYNNGLKQIDAKQRELNDGAAKLAKAKEDYAIGLEKYELYKEKTLNVGDFGCTVLTRKFNAGLVVGESLNSSFVKLRFSMAALFIVVGLLVCYSALSRIVSDQEVLIGTKKALGVSDNAVYIFYLTYTLFSVIGGCLIGGLLGFFVVEKALVMSVASNFLCNFTVYFSLLDYLEICLLHVILLLLVTYFACRRVLRRNAVDLLKGDEQINNDQRFYEKYRIWQKMSLLSKTIINNFFNDKQRVFATIVGIAGSTALIVTALTLNDNVLDSFDLVYDKYYHFDTIAFYDNESIEAKDEMETYFIKNDIPCSNIYFTRMFNVTPENDYVMSYLFIPGSDKFGDLIDLQAINGNTKDVYNGYWMCRAYDNFFDPKEDEPIKLINYNGTEKSIVPEGYFDYYLINYQNIMDSKTYEDNYGFKPIPNAFIIDTKGKDFDKIESDLKKLDGYVTFIDFYGSTFDSFDAFARVSKAVVVVYIVLAIVMYFLVVLNLLTMFIAEKKKELIVMMVNGYSVSKAKKYIYADTIFLSFVGILFGILIGVIMGFASVSSFETSVTVFLHRLDVRACLIASVTSAVMIFVISLISLKKIDEFTLSDINEL